MLIKPSWAPGLYMWCLTAIGNDTQSINNITIILSIIANKFDYNICIFQYYTFQKNIYIITKAYCINILPMISDRKPPYTMISGEKEPMPLISADWDWSFNFFCLARSMFSTTQLLKVTQLILCKIFRKCTDCYNLLKK